MRTDILQQAQAIRASMDAAALEPWQAGTSYAKGTAFVHNGAMYFARQAAVAGMCVRENGETYVCTRDIDPLLYPPSQVTAHFTKE